MSNTSAGVRECTSEALGNGSNPGDGIYVLLKEIVDNCIDEFSAGFGRQVLINIEDRQVSIRDFGRGIPLNSVIKATSQLNTGGKFDDKAFKKSVGLNGVGTKAVNALSESFYVESFRGGESSWARYERGELVGSDRKEKVSEKNGTLVVFTPDSTMFGNFEFNMDYVETMVKNYSYLKKGLAIVLNGVTYKSENGLLDLVNDNLSETPRYAPIHLVGEDIEVVLTHGNSYGENIASFVNGQNTRDGGTHLAAFREAIAKTLKDFFKKNYAPEDCRQGIIGAISIQIQEPNFEGQTKTKLGSTYMWEKEKTDGNGKKVQNPDGSIEIDRGPTIRSYVNDFIAKNLDNYLRINKDIVPIIENKIKESQAEREEIAGIQKKTRERNKKANVYNRKLRDCRFHFCDKLPKGKQDLAEQTSIFITEGDSASGTITKVRKAEYQAVFSLRGKPINCYKESRKKVAENEELNLLVSALGVEDDLDNLRYNNIIVATDADDDGMHIRMLVLTLLHEVLPGSYPPRTRTYSSDSAFQGGQQEGEALLLLSGGEGGGHQGVENLCADHEVQGSGRDLVGRVRGFHRREHEAGSRQAFRRGVHSGHHGVLHGRQHDRPPELHQGEPAFRRGT